MRLGHILGCPPFPAVVTTSTITIITRFGTSLQPLDITATGEHIHPYSSMCLKMNIIPRISRICVAPHSLHPPPTSITSVSRFPKSPNAALPATRKFACSKAVGLSHPPPPGRLILNWSQRSKTLVIHAITYPSCQMSRCFKIPVNPKKQITNSIRVGFF